MKLAKWKQYTGTLLDYDFVIDLLKKKFSVLEEYELEFFEVYERYDVLKLSLIPKTTKTTIESGLFLFENNFDLSSSKTIIIELKKLQELLGLDHSIINIVSLSKSKEGNYSGIYSPSEANMFLDDRKMLFAKRESEDEFPMDISAEPIIVVEEKNES